MKNLNLSSKKAKHTAFSPLGKTFLALILLLVLGAFNAKTGHAAVIITKPTNGTSICSSTAVGGSAPAWTTLNNIVITEQATGDFKKNISNKTITLKAPAGWQFNTGAAPTITAAAGKDISAISIVVTNSTTLTITWSTPNNGGDDAIDVVTISGVQVQATSTTSASGSVNCSAISQAVGGITAGTPGTLFADLALVASPAITVHPSTSAQNICMGAAATALSVTATGGGLTYQWYSNTSNSNIGGTAISGATSSSYTPSTSVAGTLYYYCVVTGTCSPTAKSNVSGGVTVTAAPADPANPTSNSPQCVTPGVTITRAGSPPGGVTWYWQTSATGTATTSSGSTYVVTTSGNYYLRARDNTSGCWSTGAGSVSVVINDVPGTASTPYPATAATGVCYSGMGQLMAVTWAAVAGATSYDVYFGAGSLPGTVTANVTTNSYTVPALSASTTYYWKVVPKNACGSAVGAATWTFTTAASVCSITYCSFASTSSSYYINNFSTTGGSTNITNNSSGYSTGGYGSFLAKNVTAQQGNTVNFSASFGSSASYTFGFGIWVDWNQDGDFADAGENVYNSGSYITTASGSFAVPGTALVGMTTMRIVANYNATNPTSCGSFSNAEAEDYAFIVQAGTPMTYVSSTVAQASTADVFRSDVSQAILRMEVVTTGVSSALSVTKFTVNAASAAPTNVADIQNAKIWYTGTSSTFATTTQFGSTVASPTATNFDIAGTQILASGTNYFWLTYDIKSTATYNDLVDGQCSVITVTSDRTPSTTNPAGSRIIKELYVMSNTALSTCSGTFTDEAGPNADYAASQDFTKTITSSNGGQLTFNFSSFSTESSYDKLYVYDGPTTGSSQISGSPFSGTTGPGTFTSTGTSVTFVWHSDGSTQKAGWIASMSCGAPLADMVVNSVTTSQNNISGVLTGSTSQEIIGICITTTGFNNAKSISSLTFNTTGCTNASNDIANATLWSTGSSGTFATTTQVGSVVAAPNGVFTINSGTGLPFTLATGNNYFWITYDIKAGATLGNYVDAECTSITISGVATAPTPTAPGGRRPITTQYLMSNVNVTTCTGKFYDSGGASANYGVSEAFTKTFTPGTAGDMIRCTFNSFTTEGSYDTLFIYNGGSTASPLIGAYAGSNSPGTVTSTDASGKLTFRFKSDGSVCYAGWDADISCYLPTNMAFVSAEVTQNNLNTVTLGSTSQEIICIKVTTTGTLLPFSVTKMDFNSTGTTLLSDIQNAKLFYSGTSNAFATATLVGTAATGATFSITGSQVLQEGINYFWLTYDIPAGATQGNYVDAECLNVYMNGAGGTHAPVPTTVTGDRMIVSCNNGTGAYVVTLPLSDLNKSTSGMVNDFTSANVTNVCGSTSYYTGEDVVYIFTPTTSGSITVDLTSTGSYTGLMLYDGCPKSGGTCVKYAQSSTGDKSFCTAVVAGHEYYLIIDSYASPASNPYNLTISAPSGSTLGYTCATARSIPSLPYGITGLNTACSGNDYSSSSTGACTSSYLEGDDYVFSYNATVAECITLSLANANAYASMSVYSGCPGDAGSSCLGTFHNATSPFSGSVTLPGAGNYYIIIDSDPSSSSSTPFDLSITSLGSGQPNDLPCNAIPLPLGAIMTGNNECAGGAGEPAAASCWTTGALNTVWYSFVPTSSSVKIKTALLTLSNTQIAVYSGPCGASMTQLACNDNQPTCGDNVYNMSELTVTGLTAGTTYYIRVDGAYDLVGTFSIFVIDGASSFPPVFGQDCDGSGLPGVGISSAIPVCASSFTVGNPGYQAVGNICDFPDDLNCLASGERGSVWYNLIVSADGNLEFTLVPLDYNGTVSDETDYDFAIWKTYGSGAVSCADISSGATPARCNYSYLGVTGLYSTGVTPAPYSGYDDAFEASLPVTAGDVYTMVISNYTNSTSGFSINFTTSPITYPASPTTLTWTGGAGNSDWYTPMNWGNCNYYPDSTRSAIVTTASMFLPVIDRNDPFNGGPARCKSLTINPGAALSINPNYTLEVYGNFDNSGTLTASDLSTVKMCGGATQSMNGAMTGLSNFGNFEVSKAVGSSATVTLNDDLEAGGTFSTINGASKIQINDRMVSVAGNISLQSTTFLSGTNGTLRIIGSTNPQTLLPNSNTFSNVTMEKTGQLTLLGNVRLNNTLTLINGLIITGAYEISVENAGITKVTNQNSNSYVIGKLRRRISGTGNYAFPLGDAARYALAELNITSSLTGTSSMLSQYLNTFTNTGSMNLSLATDPGQTYEMICTEGIWQFDPDVNPSGGTYEIKLHFDDGGGGSPFSGLSDNQFAPLKRPSSSTLAADWTANPPTTTIPAPSTPGRTVASGYAQRGNITSGFSQFAIGRTNTPLPVELLSFAATCDNITKVILTWTTASETNNSHFVIEKSYDGFNFIALTSIDGAGNSNSKLDYLYIDTETRINETVYYRLHQVDFDGKSSYSNVVAAACNNPQNSILIQPNPAAENVEVMIYGDYHHYSITDMLGQIIAVNQTARTIKGLKSGVYVINFDDLYKIKLVIN